MAAPALTEAQCLSLYEQGLQRHPLDRALLLAAADGQGDAADQPLGRRDARLMALRLAWLGPHLDAVSACPGCGSLMNLPVDLDHLLAMGPEPRACARALRSAENTDPADVESAHAGVHTRAGRFRQASTRDLAAVAAAVANGSAAPQAAADALLQRLALDPLPIQGLSPQDRQELERALDASDPLAHVQLQAACTHCGRAWSVTLDMATWLWDEVVGMAHRLLHQIDTLARAYGWSERDILALTPTRRALYLQVCSA